MMVTEHKRVRVCWTVDQETLRLIDEAIKTSPRKKSQGNIVDWAIRKMLKSRKHALIERIQQTEIDKAEWMSALKDYIEAHPEKDDEMTHLILKGGEKPKEKDKK